MYYVPHCKYIYTVQNTVFTVYFCSLYYFGMSDDDMIMPGPSKIGEGSTTVSNFDGPGVTYSEKMLVSNRCMGFMPNSHKKS